MKRLLFSFTALFLISATLLSSCGKRSIDCYAAATEVSLKLGLDFPIYSRCVKEGERGYCTEGFLYELYGIEEGRVIDFAVILASTLDAYGEIAILLCHTDYDAVLCEENLRARLREVIRQAGGLDVSLAVSADILREGNLLVMCAVRDGARAMRLIRGYAR